MDIQQEKILLGISSCLTGENVRFNGGNKHSSICTKTLSPYFSYKPFCPEVGIGMGVPRRPIRLVGDPNAPRAVDIKDPEQDYTSQLEHYAKDKITDLEDISGYIFVKGSPSCGLFKVKVYKDNGFPHQTPGRGLYAKVITDAIPELPVEEAGRLQDPMLRENFMVRVYAYHEWKKVTAEGFTHKRILDFHTRHKYTLMAHHHDSYKQLGQLLANAGNYKPDNLAIQYFSAFMQALTKKAARKTHTNVLMHLQGYLKNNLDKNEKATLGNTIDQYRLGTIPLIAPVILLKNHFTNHPDQYIGMQTYLKPYPDDLGLRNQI